MFRNVEWLREVEPEKIRQDMERRYPFLKKGFQSVYIFGTAQMGMFVFQQCLKNHLIVKGFIDNDTRKQGSLIHGIKVYPLCDVEIDQVILIASLAHWSDIQRQLQDEGYRHCLIYEGLAAYHRLFPAYNASFCNLYEDLFLNRNRIIETFHMLADSKSKIIYDLVTGFRLTLDLSYVKEARRLSLEEGTQYFDTKIVTAKKDEVFVDGGGYMGESTLDFVHWCNCQYKKVLFFEPDASILQKARENLTGWARIEFIEAALGEEDYKAFFDNSAERDGGVVTFSGDRQIQIQKLDDYIQEGITFIKLDTEGFESRILQGAEKIIREQKPKLAISAYHKPEDLYALREYIMKLNPDYRIYFRHYSDVYADSVLYFI